jgi:hypothetical protein
MPNYAKIAQGLSNIAKGAGKPVSAEPSWQKALAVAQQQGKVAQAPQAEALRLAQQRAALPQSKGGLGLPPNNTAEQRAAAMGFDTDVYHGTNQDFPSFGTAQPTFAAESPDIANLYGRSASETADVGHNVLPLKLRGNELTVSDLGKNGETGRFANNVAKELKIPRKELEELRMPTTQFGDSFMDKLEAMWTKRFGDPRFSDVGERKIINRLPEHGIDRLKVTDMSDMGGMQTQHMIPIGSDNIRSRFAAFDPWRKSAATAAAMGVAAPDLLAKEDDRARGGSIRGGLPRFDKGGAAFGVMPQMKPKRAHQDREASKNVPVDLARGFVSGVLGAPGDVESIIRMLPYLNEETMLPTSEDVEKKLPFKSDTPVSRAATGLGQVGGGFYTGPGSPLKVIGALPKAFKHGAEEFAKATVAGAPHVI